MGINESGTITLKILAQDLASGNIGKVIANMDRMAKQGGLMGSVMQGVGQSFGQMLNPAALVGNAIGAVTGFMGDAGRAASDLAETQSKLSAVFVTQAKDITAWAEDSAGSMGLSTQAALEATGTFGNFLQAMGQAEPAAASMSKAMVQLATDLGSFNNADPTEVLGALQSGLSGETEPLRKFGVDISDAAVQAELLAQGLTKTTKGFTQAEKIQGRYALIMRQTARAQGDFSRTSTGTANATKIAAAEIENAKAKMGVFVNAIQNAAVTAIPIVIDAIGGLGNAFDDLHRFVDPAYDQIVRLSQATKPLAAAFGFSEDAIKSYLERMRQQKTDTADVIAQNDQLVSTFQALIQTTDTFDDAKKNAFIGGLVQQIRGLATESGTPLVDTLTTANLVLGQMGDAGKESESFIGTLRVSLGLLRTPAEQATKAVSDLYEPLRAIAGLSRETFNSQMVNEMQFFWSGAFVKPVVNATQVVQDNARKLAQNVPGEFWNMTQGIVASVKGGIPDVKSVMKDLRWAIEHPMKLASTRAEIEGALTSKKLARGLRSNNALVRQAAIDARSALLTQWNGLPSKAMELGRLTIAELVRGLNEGEQYALGLYGTTGTTSGDRKINKRTHPKKKASGGPVYAGEMYEVNEGGRREFFAPAVNGTILSASQTAAMGSGGTTVHVHFHGVVAAPSEAEGARLARVIVPHIRREMGRAGA